MTMIESPEVTSFRKQYFATLADADRKKIRRYAEDWIRRKHGPILLRSNTLLLADALDRIAQLEADKPNGP